MDKILIVEDNMELLDGLCRKGFSKERLFYMNANTATYGSPPYAAVFHFYRKFGRSDSRNNLESGEIRGNMRVAVSDERRKTLD